jgi:hypothetical protein
MKKLFIWASMAFILCGLLLQIAHAAAPGTLWRYSYGNGSTQSGYVYGSPNAACAAVAASFSANNVNHVTWTSTTSGTATSGTCTFSPAGMPTVFYFTDGTTGCPGGVARDTTKPLAQQCPGAPAVCTAGLIKESRISAGTRTATGTTDMANPTNIQGCAVTLVELLGCESSVTTPAIGDAISCRWRYMLNGASAGDGSVESGMQPVVDPPAPKPEPTAPPFNPGLGQGCPKGTVNLGTDSSGGSICGGTGSAPLDKSPPPTTVKPPVVVTNGDGSTTSTKVTERLNSDGSKTTVTETTVTQPDGTSTTSKDTVTGKTPSGDTGKKDSTEEEQKADFCKQHPELNMCRNSQVSGSCETLACTGDAIGCAIARQTAMQYCMGKKLEDDAKASAQWALGNQALNGSDPLAANFPNNPAKGIPVAMPTNMDSSGWLGGGACFPDKPFTFQGQQFVIPFNTVCQNMTGFRYAVMIVALLMSFRMLAGAIFKE